MPLIAGVLASNGLMATDAVESVVVNTGIRVNTTTVVLSARACRVVRAICDETDGGRRCDVGSALSANLGSNPTPPTEGMGVECVVRNANILSAVGDRYLLELLPVSPGEHSAAADAACEDASAGAGKQCERIVVRGQDVIAWSSSLSPTKGF